MLVLEPASDDAPCPRVGIFDDAVPSAAAFATVHRTVEGRQAQVRDAIRVSVSGALSRVDYEAPMDVDITYRVQWFDSAGDDLGFSEPATTRIISPRFLDGRPRLLLHNPLDPRTAVWVHPGRGFAQSISRPVPGRVVWGQGRRLGIAQSERRRGLIGVSLDVVTDTAQEAARFDALFGDSTTSRMPILCVRIPAALRFTLLDPVWFAAVYEPVAIPDTAMWTEEVAWRMRADEVDSPVPSLVRPLLTLGDIAAYYPTLGALAADNPTLLALSRRYEIAGSGGS
ncbi:hypothetical protein [Agrococcus sp. Marseille-Q4369]|uniref:hypothetical protein n=1 Tax=Agrococcus sp. Marseille-Q4369 TaxID=2810513 RepID=UPI001B8C5CEE|nr:hypothetical protein [Agrococcus sp. Marseille-Q4369]QUW18898.1 hypothetical protein JSQ78_00490 [Agrococcus sp. Marseille-Q4369]